MRTAFNKEFFRQALIVRGQSATSFAALSGCSQPTIAAALKGRSLNVQSAAKIATALRACPEIDGLSDLLEGAYNATDSADRAGNRETQPAPAA